MRAVQLSTVSVKGLLLPFFFFWHFWTWNNKDDWHKREFPRQLLNQPASQTRFFSHPDSLVPPSRQQHLSNGPLWTMKSLPLPALVTHSMWCCRKGTEKLAFIRIIFCLKASPKIGNSSLQAYAGERNPHALLLSSRQLSAALIYQIMSLL